MTVKYTDPALVGEAFITDLPMSPRTVSGYGGKIATRYKIRYSGRMHRVYSMVYGNSGSPYILKGGENLHLDIDTSYALEALTEGGRDTDPQEGN